MMTWILSAQRSGARIYGHEKAGQGLTLVREIQHEEGRLKDSEIDTDRAGHSLGHSYQTEQSPSERVAEDFARTLARVLEKERSDKSFDDLVLVASPRMLGLIRKSLDSATASKVRGSLDKEYAEHDQARLEKALGQFFRV